MSYKCVFNFESMGVKPWKSCEKIINGYLTAELVHQEENEFVQT